MDSQDLTTMENYTTRPRFTKPRRELTKCVLRRDAIYYIKALLYYILTRKSSIIMRDDFLNFIGDLPSHSEAKKKSFTSKSYDGMWGVFTRYPHNWAARFNVPILIRRQKKSTKQDPQQAEDKRNYYLSVQFTRLLHRHFPQLKKDWKHRPDGHYMEYKCSRQYFRYLRSKRKQRVLKNSKTHEIDLENPRNVRLESVMTYAKQVYQEIQDNVCPFPSSSSVSKNESSDDDDMEEYEDFKDLLQKLEQTSW